MVLDGRKPMLNRQRWTVTRWRSAPGNGKHPPPPPITGPGGELKATFGTDLVCAAVAARQTTLQARN